MELIRRHRKKRTSGNPYAHAILRGYKDVVGKSKPNYHYEDLCELYDSYHKSNLKNISVIIDCNHDNSNKHYDEQQRIACEILGNLTNHREINRFVKGLMIESYIEDGAKLVEGGVNGKSITILVLVGKNRKDCFKNC